MFNKNKKARTVDKNGNLFEYRDRTNEILFLDLRNMGEPFEKKYIAFSADDRKKIADTYHNWQSTSYMSVYSDVSVTVVYCIIKILKVADLIP